MKKAIILGITLLSTIALSACDNSSDKSADKSSSAKTEKTSSKSSSSKSVNELGLTDAENEEYNQSLLDGLREDQDFYNNQGEEAYMWATYIDSLQYDKNRGLLVKVTDSFTGLGTTDKDFVGTSVAGLAKAQLIIIGKNEDGKATMPVNIYLGDQKLGSSRLTDSSSFKWK